MKSEFEALFSKGTFEWIHESLVPKGKQIIPVTRGVQGQAVSRHGDSQVKARLCIRGDFKISRMKRVTSLVCTLLSSGRRSGLCST
jgi:hypothetical protein